MTPEIDAEVVFRARVLPSEDPAQVAKALAFLSGSATLETREGTRTVKASFEGTNSLNFLRDQLRDRRIRPAARRLLLRSSEDGEATLLLNRQAAAVSVVALCGAPGESPLGPVFLVLKSTKLQELIDWLTDYKPE